MQGEYLSIENSKKLENYDKLVAENTTLKADKMNFDELLKKKNKIIEEQKKKIRELERENSSLKSNNKQIDMFGG